MLAGEAQEREVACEEIMFTRGAGAWTEKRAAEKQFRGHAAEGPHVKGLAEAFIAQEQVGGGGTQPYTCSPLCPQASPQASASNGSAPQGRPAQRSQGHRVQP